MGPSGGLLKIVANTGNKFSSQTRFLKPEDTPQQTAHEAQQISIHTKATNLYPY